VKSQKGFTLIELVVVLAILGILLALGVPRFTGAKRQAYKTQAYAMLGEIKALSWAYFQEHSVFPESASAVGFQSPEAAFWTTPEVRWSIEIDDPSRDLKRIVRWETIGTKTPVERQSCWLILRDTGLADQGCTF